MGDPHSTDQDPAGVQSIHIQICPWCGVRATMWDPRILAGVLLVRYRCWTGHYWSITSVVGQ